MSRQETQDPRSFSLLNVGRSVIPGTITYLDAVANFDSHYRLWTLPSLALVQFRPRAHVQNYFTICTVERSTQPLDFNKNDWNLHNVSGKLTPKTSKTKTSKSQFIDKQLLSSVGKVLAANNHCVTQAVISPRQASWPTPMLEFFLLQYIVWFQHTVPNNRLKNCLWYICISQLVLSSQK